MNLIGHVYKVTEFLIGHFREMVGNWPGGQLLLTLGAHAQRELLYLVCVSVCVCVCVCVCLSPLILALQGPSRLISDTNGSSATRA